MLGFTPGNLALYELALSHRSSNINSTENNERLEFLGDAILGAIIGEHLFIKYPTKPEGYLTDMRSKIVNRKTLNQIGLKIGLKSLMKFNEQDYFLRDSSIFGNALEALIGAIYIDKGYSKTRTFVRKRILIPFVDIELLENLEANTKNKLIGWANKQGKKIEFIVMEERLERGRKKFTVGVKLEEEIISKSTAGNKKEASKVAAEEAIKTLELFT
ncbi:MAG: ribonuclease III [Bacteroidetes bacterium]|nr:ribonuclease III [Bacteroidota bacterium]MBK8144881.1 ribonuclease III [Bacteroidota bacterium]MBP6315083.1 ribonuclease III [Chitinophagaceae bacterium]